MTAASVLPLSTGDENSIKAFFNSLNVTLSANGNPPAVLKVR